MTIASTNDELCVLYRYVFGMKHYKCEYLDSKHGRITQTPMKHKAIRYLLYDAAKLAADTQWMIERA